MAHNAKNARTEQRRRPSAERRMAKVMDFMENEVWPTIPPKLLGRRVTKRERERILGYGRGGV